MGGLMMFCKTCKFWTQSSNYTGIPNEGVCGEIGEKLTVDVKYGWDGGYIVAYETEEDFGCVLWQQK